jgi:DNA-binding CsgD family transcriptional regulator
LPSGHSQRFPATAVQSSAFRASPRSPISRIRKLQPQARQRLSSELRTAPWDSGYDEPEWSGALLARHLLLRYGISVGVRHCRRILATIRERQPRGTKAHRRTLLNLDTEKQRSTPLRSLQPFGIAGDLRNKRIALQRIQRLCSAGLPTATFAMTLFDLVGDAIPHGDIRIMTPDFVNHRWLTNIDISSWAPTFGRLLELPPHQQGITMDPRILVRKPLWRHEELEVGSFERSAGYNEFARHIGFHHVLSMMLHGPDGRLGNFPLWRSRDMGPFSQEDREFAAAILPHLDHALAVASHSGEEIVAGDNGFSPMDKHDLGLISIDARGRILASNRAAQAIFYSLQVNDPSQRSAGSQVPGDSLAYIARILRKIFLSPGGPDPDTPAPVVRIMNHPSGYQFRMRGYAAEGDPNHVFFVTIEAGETADRFAKRIMYRYGLNRTQAELLALLATRPVARPAQLAALLDIRPDTLKKSLRRLADRLDLSTQPALRTFSQTLLTPSGTLPTSLPALGS